MESLYLLIPLSIVLVFVALWVYFKAADGGQFDDLVGPALRILQDDDTPAEAKPENEATGAPSGQAPRATPPTTPSQPPR
jgi:cbb3-type cytochrome oxidase maturation protein